jgi:hypothetical protein
MANCTSDLGYGHVIVDLTYKYEVKELLEQLLSMDNDLIENEECFREDTLSLGYKNEMRRIITEALADGYPSNMDEFYTIAEKVYDNISNQEYFGNCVLDMLEISKSKVVVAWVYGGK